MILYLLLATATIFIAWIIQKMRLNSKLPPGPIGLPIVGYLPWLNAKAPYLTLTELAHKYGPIYSIQLGKVPTVVLTDPKIIRHVFTKNEANGRAELYVTHGIMKGYGLICAQGDLWKIHRKFVNNILRTLGGTRVTSQRSAMENLIKKHMNEYVKAIKLVNHPIDPHHHLRHYIGSIINEVVFGRSWPIDDPTWKMLQELQDEGVKHISVAAVTNFLPFLRYLGIFKRPLSFLIEGKLKTHEFYQKLIDEEVELLSLNNPNVIIDLDTIEKNSLLRGFLIEREKRKNTIDLEKYFNSQQYYHLLADVFGAGLDTTLTTLRWALLYFAKYEDIQTVARKEIESIINNRSPCMNDLKSMPFLEACISETQRIRSVVPLGIPHGLSEDITVENYYIPKGTMILPLQWAIHMNEEQFKNPDQFNPYNFIDNDGNYFTPSHFMPFQSGKRMCVGDEFARMILFLCLSTILQAFTLKLEDKETVQFHGDCGITLAPHPYKIRFVPNVL